MSTTKQNPWTAQSPRYLLTAALLLASIAFPGGVSAIEIKNVQGDGTCPAGWLPLSVGAAQANKSTACGVLAQWDIARLAGGGSMDGAGYDCQIRASDTRTLGNSLCIRLETLEPGKLKVCLYPGFLPFVGRNNISEWIGWDVTYLQGFAGQQNLRVVPVEVKTFNDIWTLPGNGQCDIAASGISDLPQRRQQTGSAAGWSDHYYSVYRAYAVRSADKDKLNDLNDLKGKSVIVTKGSTAELDLTYRLACTNIPACKDQTMPSCVSITRTNSEEESAQQVRNGGAFAYGGGLGSIQYLTRTLGGLAVAWPHCNMQQNCQAASEPFSFVVRRASTDLLEALNEYIANQNYPGKVPSGLQCPPAP